MNKKIETPLIPISWGELLDKITILEIKILKIKSDYSIKNIKLEYSYLADIAKIEKYPDEI